MTTFKAEVPTTQASRYLQQLCKHWSHKFEVTFDRLHGVVHLNGAECTFDAASNHLSLTLAGGDERLCGVVADHLKRFAFREELEVTWTNE